MTRSEMGRAVKAVASASVVLTLLLALSWGLVETRKWYAVEHGHTIYYYLFARYEPLAWGILLCGLALASVVLRPGDQNSSFAGRIERFLLHRAFVPALAGFVFCFGLLATFVVYHEYPLSQDEYCAAFQAEIFAHGDVVASLDDQWRAFAPALTPKFVSYDPETHAWTSSYLPVYSALRAAFVVAGVPSALNPLLGALAVLLVARVARQLWPAERWAPATAALLLATSSQLLLMSSSFYSMPAHLCANLLWLWLYLENRRFSLALAPWVGALALGLHQIVVHALFVAPFLLRLIIRRRIGVALYFAVVYLAASLLWLRWYDFAHRTAAAGEAVATAARSLAGLPGPVQWVNQSINLTLLFSWQSVAFLVAVVVAVTRFRRFDAELWDLLLGVLLTFGFYVFFSLNQGHGWGYRYIYGTLGNLILLSTFGWLALSDMAGRSRGVRLLVVSSLVALLAQLPIRAVQAETIIRPFARARDYFAALDVDYLILNQTIIWYGDDLIRNDPYLAERPLLMRLHALPPYTPAGKPATARVVGPEELVQLGLKLHPEFLEHWQQKSRGANDKL